MTSSLDNRSQPPWLPGFVSGHVPVSGCDLYYVRAGSGPPLVFLHGWPTTWWSWHKVLPALAETFTVVAFDLPGLGESGIPADGYDAATAARRIHQAVTELGFDSVGLVSHDLGSQIAYPYAKQFPEAVSRLVVADALLNGFGLEDCYGDSFHFGLNQTPRPVAETILNDEAAAAYHRWIFSISALRDGDVDEAEFLRAYAAPERRSAGYDYYRAFPANAEYNTANAGEKLKIPVLALAGAEGVGADVAGSFQAVAEDVTSVIVPACAHWIAEENPGFVVSSVQQFFSPAAAVAPPLQLSIP